MKQVSSMNRRVLALVMACVLILAAGCSKTPGASDPSGSDSSGSAFYNPLEAPMNEEPAEPEAPEQNVLEMLKEQIAANDDTVGWLRVPGTDINDAVIQGYDNKQYLRLDKYGKWLFEGCYFMDYRNVPSPRTAMNPNTVIYGHNLDDNKDGVKFGQLMRYTDLSFAKENQYVKFTTENDEMTWVIFATFYSDTKFYYHNTHPETADFSNIINEAKLRSEHNFDVDVNTRDKILTLSTCTYKYGTRTDQRFVVMARLLRAGESADKVINVTKNPTPKAPQF